MNLLNLELMPGTEKVSEALAAWVILFIKNYRELANTRDVISKREREVIDHNVDSTLQKMRKNLFASLVFFHDQIISFQGITKYSYPQRSRGVDFDRLSCY